MALDCEKKILYIAKERDKRKIYQINLSSGKILDRFNLRIKDKSNSDYSDLFYLENKLYVLERNSFLVSVFDLTSKKEIAVYDFSEFRVSFDTGLPYGLAEGLFVDTEKRNIYIAFDNNFSPRNKNFAQKHQILENNHSYIVKFTY